MDDDEWLNFYGRPITPPEYFNDEHRVAVVPEIAGLPPECTCGWTRHSGYELADHLRDMDAGTASGD